VWPLLGGRRFAPLRSLALVGLGLALREARLFATRRLPLYLSQFKGEAVTNLSHGEGICTRRPQRSA
jgi:hypothetical protein